MFGLLFFLSYSPVGARVFGYYVCSEPLFCEDRLSNGPGIKKGQFHLALTLLPTPVDPILRVVNLLASGITNLLPQMLCPRRW